MKELIIYFLAKYRNNLLIKFLSSIARSFIKGVENYSYNPKYNGEQFVMETLRGLNPKTVFDVGANRGEWALIASETFPEASIHCFEIAPPTFKILEATLSNSKMCFINDFGLADKSGKIQISFSETSDGHTTLLEEQPLTDVYKSISAQTKSGDEYCNSMNVEHIDFLKIDVEGAEDLVLKGFKSKLTEGKIDIIQFEYGQTNIISHFLLKDFYTLLEENDYSVGKIYPHYVDFRPYEYDDENFIGPNFLAIRKNLTETIRALER